MRGLWAIGTVGVLAACIPAGDFACEQSTQCSRLAGGVCQADGRCSYPDLDCDSGQRYSDLAGSVAGVCVPLGEAESSAESSAGSSTGSSGEPEGSTGPEPDSCAQVECDGRGECVMVDGAPTCACEAGLYSVGPRCLEDPCQTTTCYFVDAEQGDDRAEGSRASPWRTIDRLEQGLTRAAPGDHFLLRRGQQWSSQLDINGIVGGVDQPIVVGAYGPLDEPKPRLFPGALRIAEGSEQIVVRDLWIEDDPDATAPPNRPCVLINRSLYVVFWGNTVTRCTNRGIRVDNRSTFTVLADNVVSDVVERAGIFVADAAWSKPPEEVGPHHWIIDNVITGIPENGITIDAIDITGDVKVVGNTITDVVGIGLAVDMSGWAWVVGNTIARAGDEALADDGALRMIADGPVTGNVLLHSRYGLELRDTGEVRNNTIVHEGSAPALLLPESARDRVLVDNLVLVTGGSTSPWVQLSGDDPADDVAAMDLNWYASEGEPCVLEVMGMPLDLPGFTEATGFDAGSSCDLVPGFGAVPVDVPPADWDAAFWDRLQPDPSWSRCDAPAGARGCDGQVLGGRVEPLAGVSDNDGLGWEGPLLVRQRYGADP